MSGLTRAPAADARPVRSRRKLAALGAASLVGALLCAPSATLAATGDDQGLIDAIAAAAPAVVTIRVTENPPTTTQNGTDQGGSDQNDQQNGNDQGGSGELPFDIPNFQIGGSGSGVIITPDGLIITNRHVVENADSVDVILSDGRDLPGTVVGQDTLTDFAFVKVDATDLPTASMGESSDLKLGQRTIVIGNPLGQFPDSVSVGIVSGLDRSLGAMDLTGQGALLRHLIQTDAAVNSGNSGGAVLDGDGKLVGITTAQAGMADGIGFALPIDLAKPIIDQVEAGQAIARPWLGVSYQDIDAALAKEDSLAVQTGALVGTTGGDATSQAVLADSPAAKAGIKDGDIITSVAGVTVDAGHPLDLLLLQHKPDESVTLGVLRDGQSQDITVTLGTRPSDLQG